MATALPANVNLIQLLAASPGTTITGVEPIESVQSNTSVALTFNQMLTFAQANFSVGNIGALAGLSVVGVAGAVTATAAAITGTTDQVLRIAQNGTTLGFGPINLATVAAVTGILAGANYSAVNLATTGAGGVQGVLPTAQGGIGTSTIGQIPASSTNDSASAGKLGEYLSTSIASASQIPLSNGSTNGITSLALPPGDWNLWCNSYITVNNSTSSNTFFATLSTVSTSNLNQSPGNFGAVVYQSAAGSPACIPVGPIRSSLSATTTFFYNIFSSFSNGTCGGFGIMQARRMR
jgi:hypothetical protein